MDDFLLIHPDRQYLVEVREKIRLLLDEKLSLKLHHCKVSINKVSIGVPFVGYRIYYDHMVVRGNTLRRMQTNYRRKTKAALRNRSKEQALHHTKTSLHGHFSQASTYGLRLHMFGKR